MKRERISSKDGSGCRVERGLEKGRMDRATQGCRAARNGGEMVRTQVGPEFGFFQQEPSGDSFAAMDAAQL